jgi:DNA replication protein DnaC
VRERYVGRVDDLGMRKLGPPAAEELLEIVMRRYERASTLLTSNRSVEDWGKLFGDRGAVTATLDRLFVCSTTPISSDADRGAGE